MCVCHCLEAQSGLDIFPGPENIFPVEKFPGKFPRGLRGRDPGKFPVPFLLGIMLVREHIVQIFPETFPGVFPERGWKFPVIFQQIFPAGKGSWKISGPPASSHDMESRSFAFTI